jgi:hypothetical protein
MPSNLSLVLPNNIEKSRYKQKELSVGFYPSKKKKKKKLSVNQLPEVFLV